jgi:hypothetical protein
MSDLNSPQLTPINIELEYLLQQLIDNDENITARGVVRVHSQLKAASSITRDPTRSALLKHYQDKQAELRNWKKRIGKKSKLKVADDLANKDLRILELEQQVNLLIASHVAMIRAVGELGGYAQWSNFFEDYKAVRDKLFQMKAIHSEVLDKVEP